MAVAQTLQAFFLRNVGANYAEQRYVLAISGGLDSMVLLEEMAALLGPSQLVVAHYQHGLRGLAAEGDAIFVQEAATRLGLEFVLGRRDSGGSADEASLRALRHRFLEKVQTECEARWIVTAHHLDDLFETVLMRLVRGTGLDGLQGIPPVRGAWLRPLLQTTRAALTARAQEANVEWREDESNQSAQYLRNRVRQTLTPVFADLSTEFGGQEVFLQRFRRLVDEVRDSESALETQTRSLYVHMVVWTPFWMRFDKTLLARLTPFWKARVFRQGLKQMGVPTLDRADIARLVELSASTMPSASLAGVRLLQSCGYLYLQTPEQGAYARQPRRVVVEGLRVSIPDLETTFTLPASGGSIRFFQPGDKMHGKKLKEFFLTQRIPQPERRLLPLWVSDTSGEIIWIFPQAGKGIEIHSSAFPFSLPVRALAH
jgi:tRNA(Ile)-lysidine synthetase-like protein